MPGLSKHPLPHGFPAKAGGQHALRQTEERAPSGGPAEDGEREGPPGVKKRSHAHRMEGIQNINPEGKAPRGRGFASSCIHRLSAAAGDPAGLGFAAWMSALMVPTVGGPVRTGVCLNQNAVNSASRRRPRTDGGLPLRGYASDRRQEDAPADGGFARWVAFHKAPVSRRPARTGVCRVEADGEPFRRRKPRAGGGVPLTRLTPRSRGKDAPRRWCTTRPRFLTDEGPPIKDRNGAAGP